MPEGHKHLTPQSAAILRMIANGHSYEQVLSADAKLSYEDIFSAAREALAVAEWATSDNIERLKRIRAVHVRAYTKWSGDPAQRGNVLLWAARDRDSARMAGESSHATYIETPDSEKTEGKLARKYAILHPVLFLLRQNGEAAQGWRDTPFYWPVIRAQTKAPTVIYTAETIP
jgi:hypothetical protein